MLKFLLGLMFGGAIGAAGGFYAEHIQTRVTAWALPTPSPEVALCSTLAQASTPAPTTFRLIQSRVVKDKGVVDSITLEFDTTNRMGVPIRETATCFFRTANLPPKADLPTDRKGGIYPVNAFCHAGGCMPYWDIQIKLASALKGELATQYGD